MKVGLAAELPVEILESMNLRVDLRRFLFTEQTWVGVEYLYFQRLSQTDMIAGKFLYLLPSKIPLRYFGLFVLPTVGL